MKKSLLLIISLVFIYNTSSFGQEGFAFGVRPGIGINGAYFGANINGVVVPFVGFDYVSADGSLVETGTKFDYNLNQVVNYTEKDEASASIYNISVGVRYFFMKVESLKPYFTGTFYKPFFSADYKEDGETEPEVKDAVDNLSIWGLSFGFGTEYYFTDNFSIGGEFGIRLFVGNFKKTEKTQVYNPNNQTYSDTDRTYKVDLNLQLTYSVVSLNYYF